MKPLFFRTLSCSLLFLILLSSFSTLRDNGVPDEILSETNAFRKTKGLSALEMKQELNEIAQQHSENMARGRVSFGHTGFEKRNSLVMKSMSNVSGFAENVAFGAPTGKDAVLMWRNSDGHRKNMLGRFRYIGIGVAKDKQGRLFYTQVFAG